MKQGPASRPRPDVAAGSEPTPPPELAVARGALYGLLARLLLGEWELLEPVVMASLPGSGPLTSRVAGLLTRLHAMPRFDVKVEYDNLFVVPGRYFVPPYESFYQDASEVPALFQRVGFTLPDERGQRADHLGCELAFMSTLVEEQRLAVARADDASALAWKDHQRLFVDRHLGAWVNAVGGRVADHEPDGLYLTVFEFLDDFLRYERGELAVGDAVQEAGTPGEEQVNRNGQG